MIVVTAPARMNFQDGPSVFLAGSIEQDTAARWQDVVINQLKGEQVTIYNPRRNNWDPTLTNEITEPVFEEQVTWELEHMNKADIIAMYFDPGTKSPITLLELGLHARDHKLVVCCPSGFWRKGNVDVVCRDYGIPQAKDLDDLVTLLIGKIAFRHEYREALRKATSPSSLRNLLKDKD